MHPQFPMSRIHVQSLTSSGRRYGLEFGFELRTVIRRPTEAGSGAEKGATAYLGTLAGANPRALVSGVFNALFVAPDRILFTDAASFGGALNRKTG